MRGDLSLVTTKRIGSNRHLGLRAFYQFRRFSGRGILLLILAVLVLFPLVSIGETALGQSLSGSTSLTFHYLARVISGSGEGHTFLVTLVFGLGAALTATGLGTVLAWLVVKTDLPGYRAIRLLSYLLFAVPGLLKVIGTIELFNPGSGFFWVFLHKFAPGLNFSLDTIPGMIWTQGLLWTPVAFLFMSSTFEQMDSSFEEAALAIGVRGGRTYRYISFGLARPAAAASLLLTFIAAVTSVEVPLFLGQPNRIPTVTGVMYQRFSESLTINYSSVAALALILIVPVILLVFAYGSFLRKGRSYATVTGRGYRVKRIQVKGPKRLLGLFSLGIIVAMLLLPIVALLWVAFLTRVIPPTDFHEALSSLTLSQFTTAFSNSGIVSSAYNTVIVSLVSASLVVAFALISGWYIVWGKRTMSRSLDFLTSVPLVYPGLLIGLGVLLAYIRYPVYDTIWMFVLVYAAQFLPYGIRYVESGYRGLSRELVEAGETSGAHRTRRITKILLPLLWPSLISGWLFTYLLCLQELGASLLVAGPNTPVISVALYQATTQGSTGMVAAFGLVVAAVGCLLGVLVTRLAKGGLSLNV